jgi:predicted component of type VI protein secretion system
VNLTTSIEALNTSIWKYGLHNLSDQVLGYQKKSNQIKNEELQISKIKTQLDAARRAQTDARGA